MSRDGARDGGETTTVPTNPPALTHRTNRVAMRNETGTPVIFVDNNPISLGPDREPNMQNQRSSLETDSVEETKNAIRTLMDRMEADTGQRFYYTVAGSRAQISGNGMDDFFKALDNFRGIYADLEEQLEEPGKYQRRGYPHNHMRATGVAVTRVDGMWVRFVIAMAENDEGEHHLGSSIWITTMDRHGALAARWLDRVMDVDVVGPPERVETQHGVPQKGVGLDNNPREAPRQLRMIGISGERENGSGGEYISCGNPCYDPNGEFEMFDRLRGSGVNDDLIRLITKIDRLPLRVYGGSFGTDEDLYIGSHVKFTELGQTDGVVLVSGKTTPKRKDEYELEVEESNSGHSLTGDLIKRIGR